MLTKQDAKKFLEDFECGDLIAIENLLKRDTTPNIVNILEGDHSSDKNNMILNHYLNALKYLNYIMIFMEDEVIPWNSDFNDLYRKAISLLYEKCKEISTNPNVDILTKKWYEDCLKYNIPVSPSDVKDIVEELIGIEESKED